jgi:hypothetical protein
MMLERASRTFICSVLFLDIVEYSRKPVAEQIQLKDRFNGLIASAIQEIPAADRIILDTGDGVAINFLADPEDALFVAMSLRDVFAPDPDKPPQVPARIGINLGPVRMVKDLNGQPNIIGDGINVAQRVMAFAKAGQILVSRSYYEVVSHISEGYTQLFSYEGSRTDKHVREHEIYSVGYSTADAALKPPGERAHRAANARRHRIERPSTIQRLLPRVRHWLNNRSLAYGTAVFSSAAFLLALLTSFVATPPQANERPPVRVAVKKAPPKKTDTQPTRQSPVARVGTVASDATAFAAKDKGENIESDAASQVTTETEAETEPAPEKKKRRLSFFRRRSAPEPEVVQSDEDVAETTGSESFSNDEGQIAALSDPTTSSSSTSALVERATIVLAISPWGEVYVDGNSVGVSPPVNEVEVMPGQRTIEIRNGDFPPFIQNVELEARQKIKIRHKFN